MPLTVDELSKLIDAAHRCYDVPKEFLRELVLQAYEKGLAKGREQERDAMAMVVISDKLVNALAELEREDPVSMGIAPRESA